MKMDYVNTLNTIQEVESYRNMINEMCDKRHKFIVLCEEAKELSTKSFGFIKESFEALSPILFKSSEGKKLMNKYTKMIKENKNLSSLHTINENIRKAGSETDIDFFVNSLMVVEWGVNPSTLKEDTKKLGRVLSEAYLLVGEEAKSLIPNENVSLSNAVATTLALFACTSSTVTVKIGGVISTFPKSNSPNTIYLMYFVISL